MAKFTYGDIPDSFVMKQYYPLGRHTWDIFEELGTEYWDVGIGALSKPGALNDFFMARLNNSIETSRLVMNGTISEEDSQNMFTYSLFPPIFCVWSDLQQGFQKLMLGTSVDATFILLDDKNQEMFFALNTHQDLGGQVELLYLITLFSKHNNKKWERFLMKIFKFHTQKVINKFYLSKKNKMGVN